MNADRLFQEHHRELYRYLVRLTGDAELAADAAQQAFTRLVERPPPRDDNPRAWLFTVATNAARAEARTRTRRLRLLESKPDRLPHGDPPLRPDAALERDERRRAVRRALATLTKKERTILLMREEGFKHREIAEAVGTTPGSVGTMIARALDKLARALGLDHEEER